ncbi:MAG: hypothetical protein ACYDCQ_05410 [Dehalococcoidia bacterium]
MEQGLATVRDNPELLARRQAIVSYHTGSDEVGKVAAQAGARRLIQSHILGANSETLQTFTL